MSSTLSQMSDEDLSNLSDEEFLNYMDSEDTDTSDIDKNEEEEVTSNSDKENTSEEDEEEVTNSEEESTSDESETDTKETEEEDSDTTTSEDTLEKDEEVYKQVYDTLFKTPIKAHGEEFFPESVDEIVSLMQKGMDYTKKMQKLKPHRRLIETFNKKELKESDINNMLDLYEGKPEAIKSLLKKHNLDPIDFDLEEKDDYKPNNHIVTNEELQMEDVISTIKNSEFVDEIKSLLDGGWDEVSTNHITSNPNMLNALYEEFKHGRYQRLKSKMIKSKIFDNNDKPDFERYQELIKEDTEKESLSKSRPMKTPTSKEAIKDSKKDSAKLNKNKKSPEPPKKITQEDIDKMSDEEFEKYMEKELKIK